MVLPPKYDIFGGYVFIAAARQARRIL